jgi:hypothetical protein
MDSENGGENQTTESTSRDWLDLFLEYTEGIPSPENFRLWSGIATVAGALERRIWIETSRSRLYANLYTLLVSPPGVGKSQAILHTNELWYATKDLKVAPDNVTKPALVDAIGSATRTIIRGATDMLRYNSLLVASSEFGVLVPAHDLEFLNTLNHIYDNPKSYRENRRSMETQVDIQNPQLNILGGTQPAYLANLLPEEAWGMGFTARVIMVYSGQAVRVPLFKKQAPRVEEFKVLLAGLKKITKLYGVMTFTPEAEAEIEAWVEGDCSPAPTHSKLANYTTRRVLHVLKLSIIAAVSAGSDVIRARDFHRARTWLLDVEKTMPDIFREMVGKSDVQVIDELHFYTWQIWIKEKKAVHVSRLIHFLQHRVPSDKVLRIIDIANKANIIQRLAGTEDQYVPRPKHEHGME